MCGRYTLTTTDRPALSARFGTLLDASLDSLLGRFNAAPGQEILTIRDAHGGEGRIGLGARWGLVPSWAEDLKVGYKMINARSERVFESRAYGSLVRKASGRCLIPADGFFEWMAPAGGKGPKRPVRFTVDGGEVFSLAGLITEREWQGARLVSCTVLTTEADEVVEPIHDRMPVILADPEAETTWLEGELSEDRLAEISRPFDSARVSSHLASTALNRVGAVPEGPQLLEPDTPGA